MEQSISCMQMQNNCLQGVQKLTSVCVTSDRRSNLVGSWRSTGRLKSHTPQSFALTSKGQMDNSQEAIDAIPAQLAWEALVDLIRKRILTFAYLKRLLQGNSHYFATIFISSESLVSVLTSQQPLCIFSFIQRRLSTTIPAQKNGEPRAEEQYCTCQSSHSPQKNTTTLLSRFKPGNYFGHTVPIRFRESLQCTHERTRTG